MKKNNIILIIIILITLLILIVLSFIFTTNQNKKEIIKAEIYLKNKINSEKPYYMKSIATGDESKCGNCKNPYRGSIVYGFFIAEAIGKSLNQKEINILTKKINTSGESLWGYENKQKIKEWNDSDDTAFAMRTLEKFKIPYNLNDIEYFYNKESKDFSSFRENQIMTGSPENYESHPEVNANIYNLLLETKQKNNFITNNQLIKNSQNTDGSFNKFYYTSPYYSSYMFLSFICKDKNKELSKIKENGINFIKNNQNINGSWGKDNGNNYDTALALASLKSCGIKNKKGEEFLIKNQNADGSWDANEVFWHFKFDNTTSWDTYINSVLITAIGIIALR